MMNMVKCLFQRLNSALTDNTILLVDVGDAFFYHHLSHIPKTTLPRSFMSKCFIQGCLFQLFLFLDYQVSQARISDQERIQ
jgi:hypothetical protein